MPFCGTVHREFNSKFKVPAAEKGNSVSAHQPDRPELDLHGANGARGGKGQHCGSQRPVVADRQDTIPQQPWREAR